MIPLVLLALAAQPNPYLMQAKLFQQSGDYRSCLKRIEQAQKWESSREEQVDIAMYGGLCNFALLKTKEAEQELTLALQIDPDAKLPPFSSPKVVALFDSIKAKAGQKPEPKPVPKPEPEKTVEPAPSPTPPAPVAPIVQQAPPRRGPPLIPIIAAGAGLVALGLGIGLAVNASSLQGQAVSAEFQIDAFELEQRASGSALGANVSYAVAGAALVAALVLFFLTRGD